ncbi:hypothetical protein AN639_10835 [Candidatus Epulonipiscium fishelsonii]|uniref:Uncharacterized protein n=1 Tax=Candidatus Epulonipiscium fishelsonii TaxID=77094 RepID=A0ACC8XEC4_9FIRM|nr:hypothetical protein AN396_03635 [Epulopiscium sp. SCG-B11WGA-EpuloA1]ONI43227.1 hypothetical protein AN639_10835 [Epulopiscium sp. SCG-B05WGA-EpuloA1]
MTHVTRLTSLTTTHIGTRNGDVDTASLKRGSGTNVSETTNFTYDNKGNLLKDNKATYYYNEFNQTTKVETFDGNVQINRYDAEHLRYEMEENHKLIQFIFNTNRESRRKRNNLDYLYKNF